jgi:mannonate dehydratase
MKLMDHLDWNEVTEENLNFYKAIGVDCLQVSLPPEMTDGCDHTEEFKRLKTFVEFHGLELHVLHSGALPIGMIVYGLPGRDRQIDAWCQVLRAIGAAGVPVTSTTFYAISNFRTTPTVGRGGVRYSTFDYEELMKNPHFLQQQRTLGVGHSTFDDEELMKSLPHGQVPRITEERLWENIAYFLQCVIPVAEEAGVRIALHPDDPPIAEPLGGAARILVSVENYQRIFDLVPSDNIGMLFCQGCVAEMGVDVLETIRYMGLRNKIVFVHFRNIRGSRYKFQEVFIDEGDLDMVRAMETYREVGFNGPFMMDHSPIIPHQSWPQSAGRAYANGYIRALIQAVYR